ncbi:MAG: HD domain-containing protein [candidate division KSB1 bacterium]|nr:HD domain-containing protein [candidate division KSB1 bacterium]MDZ7369332.1 HD domain-containing protein [candidate division KSB1 bacterium]MDZ7407366.1 HD domain-containing protein [candidate division KSB1 bacterium]
MNPFLIIHKYYDPQTELYRILVTHSVLVTKKALDLAANFQARQPQTAVDVNFIYEAAMLHDIGIFRCEAPEIFCAGREPYICHGVIGREILESEGLPRHALVCERHTGAGLSQQDVIRQKLPMPLRDYLPISLEEKIICFADRFYSKTPHKLFREKKLRKIHQKMRNWGPEILARFENLCDLLAPDWRGELAESKMQKWLQN